MIAAVPTSYPHQLNQIVNLIRYTKPQSVLDIGVGFGKYGMLAREYLEFGSTETGYGEWTHRIDGIEAFGDYLTPLHDYIYDEVFVGNALEILPTLEQRYDIILLIDVLEHFERDDGLRLLELMRERGRNYIVSTPRHAGPQGAEYGNEWETHRSQWHPRDFRGKDSFVVPTRRSILAYAGDDAPRVRKRMRRYRWNTLYREFFPRLHAAERRLKQALRKR